MRENTVKDKSIFMQRTAVVWLGAMLCCLLWGSAFPCIKIGYRLYGIASSDTASQILFAGVRFMLAGVMAILIGSVSERRLLLPEKKAAGKIVWLAMLQTVLQYFFFYVGLAHTSGVKASIIEAVNVFVAVVVSGFIFRMEKVSARKLGGCLIGFAGVVIVNMNGLDFHMSFTGEGAIFLSTVAYAFSSVYLKRFSAEHNTVMLSGWQFVVGGAILTGAGVIMGGTLHVDSFSAVCMLFYLALVSAVAYSLWGVLLSYNPVSRVAVFGFMNPVFGVILSSLLLSEDSQASIAVSIVSLALVSVGIYMVTARS